MGLLMFSLYQTPKACQRVCGGEGDLWDLGEIAAALAKLLLMSRKSTSETAQRLF